MSDLAQTEPLLETRGLNKSFRGLRALRDNNLSISYGEIAGVIGPNGSGKSTLFNVITGFTPPTSGEVYFKGQRITGSSPAEVVERGIARTFQGARLFGSLTVRANIEAAAQLRHPTTIFESVLLAGRFEAAIAAIARDVNGLIELMGLDHRAERLASDLPYGDQRRLEIARALATRPALLLLDEPAAGLDSMETRQLAELIRQIRDTRKISVVVVEHDMDFIMNLCERIQVLAAGEAICLGTPAQVRDHPRVREAYLGHE